MEKLIITAAITGAELEKEKCAALPITPEEQARAAKECVEAGASVIHLHVRDEQGKPSQELAHFKQSADAIRKACPRAPIIQFSTGGAVGEAIERRIAPLSLKPDMASLNLGTINFGEDIFVNTFADMRALADAFKKNGVIPEFEIYDMGHVDNLRKLIREKIVTPPYHCQFVLGVTGAMSGEVSRPGLSGRAPPPGVELGGSRHRPFRTAAGCSRHRDGRPCARRSRGQYLLCKGRARTQQRPAG